MGAAIAGALLALAVHVPVAGASSPGRAPNIVFILIDDLGWKDFGYMGNPFVRTPAIDRLSREGMVFTDAYSGGPNCAPSRACLMSGQYTPRHGIFTVGASDRGERSQQRVIPPRNETRLAASFVTLAEALHARGYHTVHIGKWHLGDDPGLGPIGQGFDENFGGDHNGNPPQGYFPPYCLPGLEHAEPGEYLTDRLTDEAVRFLASPHQSPFFLYLAHYAVHTPIQAPESDVARCRARLPADCPLDPAYVAMIEAVDRGVDRVLRQLDRSGLTDDTLVVLVSDNGGVKGTSFLEPLRGGKGMLYEGGIRVPMVVRWPGHVRAGSSCAEPVTSVDFYPTLLDVCGAPVPPATVVDGSSLVPLFESRPGFSREAIFWHFPAYLGGLPKKGLSGARDTIFRERPCGAIRSGNWKLIEYFEDGSVELFNLQRDIGEQRNLAGAEPAVRDRLAGLLHAWQRETAAPMPSGANPDYRGPAAEQPRHVVVYHRPGQFAGWPANRGIWSWGDEILVGFHTGYYLAPSNPGAKGVAGDPRAEDGVAPGEVPERDRSKPERDLLARSLDGGVTWTIENPAERGEMLPLQVSDETPLESILPRLKECPGGIDFTHPGFAMTLRKVEESDIGPSYFHYSYDRGHTWRGPYRLPNLGTPGLLTRTCYLVEDRDSCLAFLTAAKADRNNGCSLVARTDDGGGTWRFVSWIGGVPRDGPGIFAIMPTVVRLGPDELYAVLRERDGEERWLAGFRSLDLGRTWTRESDPAGRTGGGNPGCLVDLGGGRLALTYGVRDEPVRICAKLSPDGGRNWGPEIVLRDDGSVRPIGYTRSVIRTDGRIVTVYYFADRKTGPEQYIGATIWDPATVPSR